MCQQEPMPCEPVIRMTAPPAPPAPPVSKAEPPAPRLLPGGFVALTVDGESFRWPTVSGS